MMHQLLFAFILVLFVFCPSRTGGLENGLARTPPMGWMTWERFRCNIDCKNDSKNCISERLIKEMADRMVLDGYSTAGYEYVVIDDCWSAKSRDNNGKLQANSERFPSGIKALANYVHSKGLKFGIYADYGNFTCEGYPGSLQYLETDANTFAEWGVDYVKMDGCYSDIKSMDIGYPEFQRYMNKTGRSMIFSCSWPVYQIYNNIKPNFTSIIDTCNLWRYDGDINDSWNTVYNIIDNTAKNQNALTQFAGPGHWNDPDMLIIGNFGLNIDQSQVQMGLWAIIAAPLLMSNDLRNIKPEYKTILQNRNVIAVNQDRLGIQGKRIYKKNGIEIWTRPITPVKQSKILEQSYAVLILNTRTDLSISHEFTSEQIGLGHEKGYTVKNLFTNRDCHHGRKISPKTGIKVKVNPTGCVLLRFKICGE